MKRTAQEFVEPQRYSVVSAVTAFARVMLKGFASKVRICTWTGSVQGAVATWSVISKRYFLTILTPLVDQVATAPCTDPVQDSTTDF